MEVDKKEALTTVCVGQRFHRLAKHLSSVLGLPINNLVSLALVYLARNLDNVISAELEYKRLQGKNFVLIEVPEDYESEFFQALIDSLEKSGKLEQFYRKWLAVKSD